MIVNEAHAGSRGPADATGGGATGSAASAAASTASAVAVAAAHHVSAAALDVTSVIVPVDRVTTNETAGLTAALASGIDMAATERGVRLTALARAIHGGVYKPSAVALAAQILAAADLDVRLFRGMNA